ncbi:hypothetical protein GRFL_3347 [Christiangramia flava JLT2011]|uniref:Uncharacterized protein n=1 Tax=Christiangramia flava JLT2011 TaxID=1229726 RepID=A0A1L7I8Y5_9FLAO|nr:hypothetical protein GRFL_3347 [Christiangramia flava JLT2011]
MARITLHLNQTIAHHFASVIAAMFISPRRNHRNYPSPQLKFPEKSRKKITV